MCLRGGVPSKYTESLPFRLVCFEPEPLRRVEAESEEEMDSVIVHFPDGDRELVFPAKPLKEGDTIWHDGARWRILSIAQNDGGPQTATVEPESDDLGNLLTSEEGALRLVPVG
jgi:hypothetical protein